MADTIESIKKELEEVKAERDSYKLNGALGLYYELNRFVNGTVELMRTTKLSNLLKVEKDEDPKKFERMMALIKNAKEHTIEMVEMKSKLNLTGDEEEDLAKKPFLDLLAQKRD